MGVNVCCWNGCLWFMPPNTTISSQVYLNTLQEELQDSMLNGHCHWFQHDGAPCHSAKVVKNWLVGNNIQLLHPWPGSSPDLNPIENCWAILKKKVAQLRPTSLKDLENKIKSVCTEHITPGYCKTLIDSMPSRIQVVLAAKGGHTKY